MKSLFDARSITVLILLSLLVTVLVGCSCPIQRVRFIPGPEVNKEATINVAINKQGKFVFVDEKGKPSQTTISFDQFVTRTELRSKAIDAKQQAAAGGQKQSKDYYKKEGFKKIQTIEVYRRKGSIDLALCMDNVCECSRYNNRGQYCCACNCDCPN